MSDDITYCGYSKCPNIDCERHTTHSTKTYDSFAYFDDCSVHKQLRGDDVLATCEALSTLRRTKNERK